MMQRGHPSSGCDQSRDSECAEDQYGESAGHPEGHEIQPADHEAPREKRAHLRPGVPGLGRTRERDRVVITETTIEAVNLLNYIEPLFTFTLPEYRRAFQAKELQALARGANRLFGYGFSVSLTFFGVFCALTGYLIFRSRFLPAIIGILMVAAGVDHWINSFVLFLALPPIPDLFRWVTLIAESSLALWLFIVGVNEGKWRSQVEALQSGRPLNFTVQRRG